MLTQHARALLCLSLPALLRQAWMFDDDMRLAGGEQASARARAPVLRVIPHLACDAQAERHLPSSHYCPTCQTGLKPVFSTPIRVWQYRGLL